MNNPFTVTHDQVFAQAAKIAHKIPPGSRLYGIPRGGIAPAYIVKSMVVRSQLVDDPRDATVFIDDIKDSGTTASRYAREYQRPVFALFNKDEVPWKGRWLVMPWEMGKDHSDTSGDDIIVRLLEYIGEDPKRPGLKDTPKRVLQGWKEWASGYKTDVDSLFTTFEDGAYQSNEMVIVHNIPVISKCEHHLADIVGKAHVGYIPNGKIIGLSKLARIVDAFARRLQVQERLTHQIADCLGSGLDPKGVGVLVRAAHACMSSRGVKIHGSLTTTSAVRGALLNKPEARSEFLTLCDMAERNRE